MHCWSTTALLPGCIDTERHATFTEVMLVEQYGVIPANSTVGDVRAPNTPLANLLAPTGITTTDNAVAKAKFWQAALQNLLTNAIRMTAWLFPRHVLKPLLECPAWTAKYNSAAANVLRYFDSDTSFFELAYQA